MEIAHNINQEVYNATLTGRFIFDDYLKFREVLNNIEDGEVKQVVLHMAAVDFVDSAALGMLLLARDEAKKNNKEIVISGTTGQVKKTLELAKFDTMFTIK